MTGCGLRREATTSLTQGVEPAFAQMMGCIWVFTDALQSHWDRRDPAFRPVAESLEQLDAARKRRLRLARRASKQAPWQHPNARAELDDLGVTVLEGREFLPVVSKCVRSEWGTSMVAWEPDTPLEQVLELCSRSPSEPDDFLDSIQVAHLDTMFMCLADRSWAFYACDSQRRDSLLSAVRGCLGAVVEESLVLRPKRGDFTL